MARTRGSRFRLPPDKFKEDDLVIDIAPPKSPIVSANSSLAKISQHTDDNRFGRHRTYLLQECPGNIKFRGVDDFMEIEGDQILIGDVYGWYEVSDWHGAQEQKRKTTKLIAKLKGEDIDSDERSSPAPFDDEDVDQTFGDDDRVLRSEDTHADDFSEDEVIYAPTPIAPRSQLLNNPPAVGAFTPARVIKERRKSLPVAKIAGARRRPAHDSAVRRLSYPNFDPSPGPHRHSNAASAVLAALDYRQQKDIEDGFISPNSKRAYTEYERDLIAARGGKPSQWTVNPQPIIDPALQQVNAGQKRKSTTSNPTLDLDLNTSHRQPKRPKTTTITPPSLSLSPPSPIDPCLPLPQDHILPNPPPTHPYRLWPAFAPSHTRLPLGYRVRVRFISNAPSILAQHIKTQSKDIDDLIEELLGRCERYLLATPEWRAGGQGVCRERAKSWVVERMRVWEQRWGQMFEALGVTFSLPEDVAKGKGKGAVRMSAAVHHRTKRAKKDVSVSVREEEKTKKKEELAEKARQRSKDKTRDAYTLDDDSEATITHLVTRQLAALLETIRFQTSIPESATKGHKAKGAGKDTKHYEANCRLAALAWQVEFFEGWCRKMERFQTSQIYQSRLRVWVKVIESGDEELGGKKVFEKIDLLTGRRETVWPREGGVWREVQRVWEKQEAGVVFEKSEPELFWTNGRVEEMRPTPAVRRAERGAKIVAAIEAQAARDGNGRPLVDIQQTPTSKRPRLLRHQPAAMPPRLRLERTLSPEPEQVEFGVQPQTPNPNLHRFDPTILTLGHHEHQRSTIQHRIAMQRQQKVLRGMLGSADDAGDAFDDGDAGVVGYVPEPTPSYGKRMSTHPVPPTMMLPSQPQLQAKQEDDMLDCSEEHVRMRWEGEMYLQARARARVQAQAEWQARMRMQAAHQMHATGMPIDPALLGMHTGPRQQHGQMQGVGMPIDPALIGMDAGFQQDPSQMGQQFGQSHGLRPMPIDPALMPFSAAPGRYVQAMPQAQALGFPAFGNGYGHDMPRTTASVRLTSLRNPFAIGPVAARAQLNMGDQDVIDNLVLSTTTAHQQALQPRKRLRRGAVDYGRVGNGVGLGINMNGMPTKGELQQAPTGTATAVLSSSPAEPEVELRLLRAAGTFDAGGGQSMFFSSPPAVGSSARVDTGIGNAMSATVRERSSSIRFTSPASGTVDEREHTVGMTPDMQSGMFGDQLPSSAPF